MTGNPYWWRSDAVEARPVRTVARALEIAAAMNDPESALAREVELQFGDVAKHMNPAFWDAYFHAYDTLVFYNGPYRELLGLAHAYLPLAGDIVDLGAGTGNFSIALAEGAPLRNFVLVDQSPQGLEVAAAKFRRKAGAHAAMDVHRHRTVLRSLLDPAPFPSGSGAVLNNVLYSVSSVADKERILRRVCDCLTPGGKLFLNDPTPVIADGVYVWDTVLHLVTSAVLHESPMTEFDLVVLMAANKRMTKAEGKEDHSVFLNPADLEHLCTQAGFQVDGTRVTYADTSRAYFLRKP
jgi:SAM-dependent methyltransferase